MDKTKMIELCKQMVDELSNEEMPSAEPAPATEPATEQVEEAPMQAPEQDVSLPEKPASEEKDFDDIMAKLDEMDKRLTELENVSVPEEELKPEEKPMVSQETIKKKEELMPENKPEEKPKDEKPEEEKMKEAVSEMPPEETEEEKKKKLEGEDIVKTETLSVSNVRTEKVNTVNLANGKSVIQKYLESFKLFD